MAKYEKFEALPVWQEAARLYNTVLDLLAMSRCPLSPSFRNRLDRAALSVSNKVAEGFERVTTAELLGFLAIARGSAGEVRSMIAVVVNRPALKPVAADLARIRALAGSCAKQITAWTHSIEGGPVRGKRHLTPGLKTQRTVAAAFRLAFLKNLRPDHPLYRTPEARASRGERDLERP